MYNHTYIIYYEDLATPPTEHRVFGTAYDAVITTDIGRTTRVGMDKQRKDTLLVGICLRTWYWYT